jgi:pimeloyl-ACP methyl ester carboxylesterase
MNTFSNLTWNNLKSAKIPIVLALFATSVIASVNLMQNEKLENTQDYYSQQLSWTQCYSTFQCAELKVPVDYDDFTKGSFDIAVIKYEALDKKNRFGSLVVNPGGPGASGFDYAYSAEYLFSPNVLKRYDIVGFDPRGVARSSPIRCLNGKETDAAIASDSYPDNDEEFEATLIEARSFINKCIDKNKNLMAYGTENTARDMDLLRVALGDEELNFMGKSYGTYLGTLYAYLFPDKVGRMVLDGAIDPSISTFQQSLAQAVGFDTALKAFVEDCSKRRMCTLSKNKSSALEEIKALFAKAKEQPIRTQKTAESDGRPATESIVVIGTASALYDSETGWPLLRKAIKEAQAGFGDTFLKLVDDYQGRQPDGSYQNNEFDSGAIINCLDFRDSRTREQVRADETIFASAAPVFGPYLAYSGLACEFLTDAATPRHFNKIKTTNPIVVIGTTGDPATPYAWAKGLHGILASSSLITFKGDGHTGQGRGNSCIDEAVDQFYLFNRLPPKDLTCS